MKNYIRSLSGWSIHFFLGATFFLLISGTQATAQSIRRQSIGIGGASMVSGAILIKQSIGQPYATSTYYQNGIGFRPGFQQPSGSNARMSVIGQELVQGALNMKVYPNPATHSFSIESQGELGQAWLKVMDSNGRLVVQQKLNGLNSHSINCENWAKGLYLISITDEHHSSYSSKLIIAK